MGFILKVLSGSLGPYLLGGLALLSILGPIGSGFYFHHTGYQDGQRDERLAWQKVAQKAADDAAALAHERQARKDDAAEWRSERDQLYATKVQPIHLEVQSYAKTPAGTVRCIDDAGVRIGASSIAAANASLAGDPGGRK